MIPQTRPEVVADVSGNNTNDVSDVVVLTKFLHGKINAFPEQQEYQAVQTAVRYTIVKTSQQLISQRISSETQSPAQSTFMAVRFLTIKVRSAVLQVIS